jgi:F-type H+-transporting ATPase subunit delta
MTELATLARPYASAVFKCAKEMSATAKWSEQLAFMSAIVGNKEMSDLINNPKVKNDRLLEMLLDVSAGHIDHEGANFLKLLLHNNRLGLLPTIAALFEELKAEDEGYIAVDVYTAFAFTKEAEKKFAASLEKKLSKKIHMNVALDKSLIGGVLVRAGDQVIDGSIRGQLQNLQKALL